MSQPSASVGPAGPLYAGQRLGLPEAGRGSVATWSRRILALVVDWFASLLVASAVEGSLLTALVGGSFGQLVLRVAVVRLDRRPVSLLVAVVRTLLICLVVPPVIYNRDRRGLHDLVAGTVTVRR